MLVHHGAERARGRRFANAAAEHALVLSSYALLHRDLDTARARSTWAGVVLDEAQNIKNPETKQAQAARALAARLPHRADRTPVENHVGDLWSIMEFLNPGFLGSAGASSSARFFVPIQAGRDAERGGTAQAADRPVHPAPPQDRQAHHRRPARQDGDEGLLHAHRGAGLALRGGRRRRRREAHRSSAEGIQRKGCVLATLSKLKQVCNHPAQFLGDNSPLPGRSGKLARLTEMLEEVLRGGRPRAGLHPVRGDGRACCSSTCRRRSAARCCSCTAACREGQRDRMVERFQSDEDAPPVFVLSLKAGGTGPEPDGAPTTSSTSTAGGTRPSRTRPPTAPSASARRATCRSTSSSAPARWRRRSTR